MQAMLGLLRTMRPKQWTKNVIVVAALVFDRKLTDPDALLSVLLAFILLIGMSGTVYIINDLVDIEKDRQHPKKRLRPLPSGQLPPSLALIAAIILPLIVLGTSWALGYIGLTLVLLLYLLIQIAYSFILKHVVLLDVMTVASGFVLRVLAGVAVIEVDNFSPWLYACAGLLALFLAVGKRRQELVTLGPEEAVRTRPIFKDYNLPLLDDMLRLVTTSTFITYLVYTIEVETMRIEDINAALITVPFVLYALYRYLYLIHVRGEGSAPDEVLLTDRPLQVAIVLWGLTFLLLLYVFPVPS